MIVLPYLVAKLYESVLVRSIRLESGEREQRYGGNLLGLAQEILGDSGAARICAKRLLESQLIKLMVDMKSTGETIEHPNPTPMLENGERQVYCVLVEEYQIRKEVLSMEKMFECEQVLSMIEQLALTKKDGWVRTTDISRALPDLPMEVRRQSLQYLVRKGVLVLKGTRGTAQYCLAEIPPAKVREEVPSSDEELLVQLQEKIQKLDEDIAELKKMMEDSQQKRDELGTIRDDLRKLAEARQRARELLAGN